ncbi:Dirigent-like protein [Musa troglodytarum]|uniref:Dirigent protein n=1 Tax=Musa troglodytarum TaxID=320322 RepID=A0A9E7GZ50_9LILI|nr:Dirigent-like protein [Musa troglodytarum]
MKQKVTNLHFFFHDILSGDKPTSVQVAAPKNLSSLDDPLTEGPEADSKVLGSAQGYYIIAGQDSPMLVLAADYGFTTGPYNGSSFSVFSRNPVMDTDRELAVVGGRGAFRMAQGIAKLHTHSIDATTGDAVVEYNVTLFHYE